MLRRVHLRRGKGLAATDVILSMFRLGFSPEEIYDTLTGAGLPGEEVQLLIDRVEAEFEEARLETRTSRMAKEVEGIFRLQLEKSEAEIEGSLHSLIQELKSLENEFRKLEERVLEVQTLVCK